MHLIEGHISIKDWSAEDQPREKLISKGRSTLSEAELMAILIGSGTRNESAVKLCQRILSGTGNDLNKLSRLSISELIRYAGIGPAKAVTLIAALELGRRRQLTRPSRKKTISSGKDVFRIMQPVIGHLEYEEFHVLYFSRSNKVIGKERISIGGVSGTVADVKIILRTGIHLLASAMILCHNHPSGTLRPSQKDINTTDKIKFAGKSVDIDLLDHIIITEQGFYSFAENGNL